MSAVERVNSAVSSFPLAMGTGDSKSPSTNSFIRSTQFRIGTLIVLDNFNATTMEASIDAAITATLINIPK